MIGQGLAPSPYREAIDKIAMLEKKLAIANLKIAELKTVIRSQEDDNK
jgi:hypothetical protein